MRFFLSLIFIGLVFTGCNERPERAASVSGAQEIKGEVFGSYYIIKYRGELNRPEFERELAAFFKGFNDEFSTYQKDSLISRFNETAAGKKLKVSPRFISMLVLANELYEKTQGAFDPTLGPVIRAWGFGGGEREGAPDETAIKEARKKVGIKLVHWDEKTNEIWKAKDGVQLDINAFAPGWAADLIGEILEQHKIVNYMVDISGEILLRGEKAPGSRWKIGIERPSKERTHGVQAVLSLKDEAVATSGDYRQFFNDKGVRRSHIIDPRTGRPVDHTVSSASVVTKTAAASDAWGTAMMVLGESGIELAEKNGVKVFLLEALGPGEFKEIVSPSMATLMSQSEL